MDRQGHKLVKLLLIEKFIGNKNKLKEFLTQINIKIVNKGLGLLIFIKQVVYTRLYLISNALEWFKFYLTKIWADEMTTTNLAVGYIFLL